MNVIQQSTVFATWLGGLGDLKARARILARIEGAKCGNFGDCEPVGDGVSEMRIDFGPGYRVYCMREGGVLYVLLCGGDKSTQQADIAQARKMANQVRRAAKAKAESERETSRAKVKPKAKAKAKKG